MTAAALVALALSAEPSLLRLGTDAHAVIRVAGGGQPVISASVGSVQSLRPTEEGTWEADYIPPDEALPQVAILTAVSAGAVAFIAIPLWGAGDAVVKTRPRGRISVDIGNQTFGPATADEHGEAVVPVVVPPGVQEAHHGKRIIPLHVPPSRTIHVAFGEALHLADQAQTVAVYVAATSAQGTPRSGAAVRLETSRGNLTALHEREPGLYEAWLSLSPGKAGEVRVKAALDDAAAFVAEAALVLGGGPAQTIAISADRERIGADDPQARFHVSARDAAGNPAGDTVEFESTAGKLLATAAAPGEWDLALTVAPAFGGRQSLEVRAHGPKASATKALALVPGAPGSISFSRPSASVVADGASRLRLQVQLRDRYGNAIRDVRPELSAGQGTAELEERDGALYASYLAPPMEQRGDTTLALRAGPLETRARVTLLPNLKQAAVSAKAGMLSNFSGFSVPLLGVEAALRTQRLGPQLAVALGADYGHRSQTELIAAGAGQVAADSRLDLLLVHLSGSFRQPFGDRNTFSIGAGPCAAAYWTRVGIAGGPDRRGFAMTPGLQGTIGAERRLHWGTPFLEVRAAWVTSPGLPILTGPLRTISLMAGVRLETL